MEITTLAEEEEEEDRVQGLSKTRPCLSSSYSKALISTHGSIVLISGVSHRITTPLFPPRDLSYNNKRKITVWTYF